MKNKLLILLFSIVLLCWCAPPAQCRINWNYFNSDFDKEALKTYPYFNCFEQASKKHNVPILLLLSVAKGESNFNPRAVSNKGAIGIMQILWPQTAKDLGFSRRKDLFDPCRNIDAGARYLAWLLGKYDGDTYLALAAYFSGLNRVKKGNVPDYGTDYANYIYAKLIDIKGTHYRRIVYLAIMRYDKYFFADNFRSYVMKKDPSIPLEINKNALNQYVVSISAESEQSREGYRKKIEQITGLKL